MHPPLVRAAYDLVAQSFCTQWSGASPGLPTYGQHLSPSKTLWAPSPTQIWKWPACYCTTSAWNTLSPSGMYTSQHGVTTPQQSAGPTNSARRAPQSWATSPEHSLCAYMLMRHHRLPPYPLQASTTSWPTTHHEHSTTTQQLTKPSSFLTTNFYSPSTPLSHYRTACGTASA